MLTNSDCTVYTRIKSPEGDSWMRQYIPGCWWFCNTKSSVTTEGLKSADVLTVRIEDLSIVVKKDDVLVEGNCPVEMETVKDLAGYQYFKATSANYNCLGDNPHIKVVAT